MRIGLTMRITEEERYYEPRDAISHDWIIFLQSCGKIPVLIPNGIIDINDYLDSLRLDSIILTGGDNIITGKDKINSVKYIRDKSEREVIKYCINNKIPLIGICRGMQHINYYFKGNHFKLEECEKHVAKEHPVKWNDSGLNAEYPLLSNFIVNSYHELGISSSTLGSELEPIAFDESGNIEGFRHKSLPVVGIMWHPERKFSDDKISKFHKNGFFDLIEKIINKNS